MNRNGRISALELILICFIVCGCIYMVPKGLAWYGEQIALGNDNLALNTAKSVAMVSSEGGATCPVETCNNFDTCTHMFYDCFIGYYDATTKHIVGEKMKGYNQSEIMYIDGAVYTGEPGTMIIQVSLCKGELSYSWTKGE